jgi:hypothetical protein
MASDQTKIKIPPRMKIETFMNQMQKKTKQILCLLNNNEVLIMDLEQLSHGLWKKWKEDDTDCFHYIDEDKNEHIKIFSEEANKKLGSIPIQTTTSHISEKDEGLEIKQYKNKFEEFMNHPSIQTPIPMVNYQQQPIPPPNPYLFNNKNKKESQKIANMQKFNQIQNQIQNPMQNQIQNPIQNSMQNQVQPNFTTTSSFKPQNYQQSFQQNYTGQGYYPYSQQSNRQQQIPNLPQNNQNVNQMYPLNTNPLSNGIPSNIMNQFNQESVMVAKNSENPMISNYYEQNRYIPFYNGVKQVNNKNKQNMVNEKPLKLESKYMA